MLRDHVVGRRRRAGLARPEGLHRLRREEAELSRQSRPSSGRQEVKNLCAKQKSPKMIQLQQVVALIYGARLSRR